MYLNNCEINLILTWSEDCVISSVVGNKICNNRYKTLCGPVVILSTQNNAKLLEQLKSDFKRAINWNWLFTKLSLFQITL